MVSDVSTLRAVYMIEPLAGLIPRPQVARVRKVERKPKSKGEHNDKEDLLDKRENSGSSQGTFLDRRGNLLDQLL